MKISVRNDEKSWFFTLEPETVEEGYDIGKT